MSRYAPSLAFPPGFQYVVQDFSREVLRKQPSNIYAFAAAYFLDKIQERAAPRVEPKAEHLSPAELEAVLSDAFVAADEQHNGFLHHSRFAEVLRDVRLELNERQIQRVMAEADENDYGMIEYATSNFIAVAVDVISRLYEQGPAPEVLAAAPVDVLLGRGLHREDFDRLLEDSLFAVDPHNSGVVSRSELRRALAGSAIGLTAAEINVLMYAADETRDGLVVYASYIPKCFDCIRTFTLMEMAEQPVPRDEWRRAILDVFLSNEPEEQSGRMHRTVARNLLMRAGLGLTHMWIYALLAEVDEDDDGTIDFEAFADIASESLAAAYQPQAAVQFAAYVRKYATSDLGEVAIKTQLSILFGGSAEQSRAEVLAKLRGDSELALTAREVNGLMATVSETQDGVAVCDVLLTSGYDVIKTLAFRACAAKRDTPPVRPTARSEAADAIMDSVDASMRAYGSSA